MEQLQSESLNSILANKQLELKVVREHLKAGEAGLIKVKLSVEKSESKVNELQNELRLLGIEKAKVLKDIVRVKKQLELSINEKNQAESLYKAQKREFNEEVSGRKAYLEAQEVFISETIEEGNEKLKILQYETQGFTEAKQEIENEIYDSKQILEQLGHEISNEATKLAGIQKGGRYEVESLNQSLENVRKEIREAQAKLEITNQETDAKLAILKGKEGSIIARENAIRLRTEEANLRERRLNSAEHLYT